MYLIERVKATKEYLFSFLKWAFIGIIIGVTGGAVGSVFHKCIDFVTEYRVHNSFVMWFLPLAVLIIVALYRLFNKCGKIDTNRVLESIRSNKDLISNTNVFKFFTGFINTRNICRTVNIAN